MPTILHLYLTQKGQVSVSLRSIIHSYLKCQKSNGVEKLEFPSPYGVSFILIKKDKKETKKSKKVSVSLRSIIHSYIQIIVQCQVKFLKVSVSLRSIIHSYHGMYYLNGNDSTEFPSPYGVSFILIKPINSAIGGCKMRKFPSPYGVSFILIQSIVQL